MNNERCLEAESRIRPERWCCQCQLSVSHTFCQHLRSNVLDDMVGRQVSLGQQLHWRLDLHLQLTVIADRCQQLLIRQEPTGGDTARISHRLTWKTNHTRVTRQVTDSAKTLQKLDKSILDKCVEA